MSATVSVIVVNYNRAALLRDCLNSLLAQTAPPAEIIVADNGSTDGSAAMVNEEFSGKVRLYRLEENLGFAGGNNAGARLASSDWLALINNDAVADPRWLERMCAVISPGVGLVACRILRAADRDLLENTGVALWPDGMSRGTCHLVRDGGGEIPPPLIPSGCAMMVRREAFEKAGGFDESFFAYSEDTDLGLKVRLMGYRCEFASRAFVHHHGASTLGVISPQKIYLVERNRFRVLFRYFPWTHIIASPLYTALRYLLLLANLRGGDGSGGSIVSLLRAWKDGLAGLPADLALRGKLLRGPAAADMKYWLRRYRLDMKNLSTLGPS